MRHGKVFVVATVVAVGLLAACHKDSGGSSTSAPTTGTAAAVTAATVGAATPQAAPPPAAPAKPAFVQKGIPNGKVIVGYLADASDPDQCAAMVDTPAKKDDYTKHAAEVAKMVKGKVVASCPTDNVVGTCNAGFGMLVNYSGPKWTEVTAKKDCASNHQKWVD